MKRAIIAAFLAVVLMASVHYVSAGDNDARALLQQSVDASGGMEAMGAWKTVEQTGELYVHWEGWGSPHAKATLRVKRPDKLVLDQDFSVYDHPFFFTFYYNGGDVWAMVNLGVRQNPRYTQAMTWAMKNTGGMHYYLSKCDTFFLAGDVPDDSLVVGSTVDRVGIVDSGDTVIVDLDKQTHLPVRLLRDNGAEQSLFADYRTVGALTLPHKMTVYQDGAISAEYSWESIVFDRPLDDAIFEEHRPKEQASG